jgi:N6-adenosine-specific RNA methylase IME4
MSAALTRYDKARKALSEAHSVDEVKEIMDQGAAVAEYARRAKDLEMIAWATAIQQDAARKAGELLRVMKERGERDTGHGDRRAESQAAIPKLADLGVSATQSSRWQKLAALPEEEFEARKAAASKAAVASVERTREERQAEKRERRHEREAELGARVAALPDKRYGVIYADPEWKFDVYSEQTGQDRAAANHYPVSDLADIKARDVAAIAAEDCVLFLWATVPMLPQALEVMAAWGFAYKSHVVWLKDRLGTGYWFRNCHEILLLGTRGEVPAPAMGDQYASAFDAEVGEHSAKPEIFAQMIEEYFPSLPKIELNRRGPPRAGWDAWGNEAEAEEQAA